MNRNQKQVVLMAAGAIILFLLFPPTSGPFTPSWPFRWISDCRVEDINVPTLLYRIIVVVAVAGGAYVWFATPKKDG